jgi:integrase
MISRESTDACVLDVAISLNCVVYIFRSEKTLFYFWLGKVAATNTAGYTAWPEFSISAKGLLTKAKLPTTIRFHDLRHFAATTLLSTGVDISTTQAILGHIDASVTLNFYAHAIPDRTRIVVDDVVNNAFGGKSEKEKRQ